MNVTLALDIGGTGIKGALVNDKGQLVHFETVPTEASLGAKHVLSSLQSLAQTLLDVSKQKKHKVRSVGVGTPGVVDPQKGCVIDGCPNIPGWKGVPFMLVLQKQLGLPVFAHNDVTLLTLGEHRFGAGQGSEHMLCIALGTGIGGGIIIDHKLYEGASAYAGEVGHMYIGGKEPCGCGQKGCWEAYGSASGFVRIAQKRLRRNPKEPFAQFVRSNPQNLNPKNIFLFAKKRDPFCEQLVAEYCQNLAYGLVNLVNIFNPQLIVIGGGIAQEGPLLWKPLRAMVKSQAMALSGKTVKLKKAKLGGQSGVVGAAAYAMQKTLGF